VSQHWRRAIWEEGGYCPPVHWAIAAGAERPSWSPLHCIILAQRVVQKRWGEGRCS
jgi:hypothetical protein